MTVNILIAEHFRFFSVGNDFFGILFVDLVILAFTDFARCEVIAVSVGITVPGKILPFPIDRSVSAAKPYDEFYERYIELTKRFDDTVADTEAIKKAVHKDGIGEAVGKGAKAVGGFFGGLFNKKKDDTPEKDTNEGTDFFNFGAKIEAGILIPDQMFRYAVLSYYLDDLADFIGIK